MSIKYGPGGNSEIQRQSRLLDAMALVAGDDSRLPQYTKQTLNLIQANTPVLDAGSSIVFIGDSITEGESGSGAYTRIMGNLFVLANRVRALEGFNQGIGGDRTQDILARIDTVTANMRDIADLQIGTNDVSWNITTATYIDNVKKIIHACLDHGAKVVVVHGVPLKSPNASNPWTAEQVLLRDSYNAALGALDIENVFVELLSPEVITDPDNMYSDGTHLSWWGSYVFGAAQASHTLAVLENVTPTLGCLTDNQVVNPGLSGSGGGTGGVATGDVADGWSVGSNFSGVSVTCSKSENIFGDFVAAQTITLSGVSPNTAGVCNFQQDIPIVASPGDQYQIMVRFKIEAGHQGLSNIIAQCGSDFRSVSESKYYDEIYGGEELSGYLCTTVRSALDGDETVLPVKFVIRVSNTDVDAVVHFDKPIVRKL